jgi:hypothetical protein
VILNEEGVYRLYDLQGDYVQFSLGTDAGEVGITDARIHENGLVAMTGSLQLLEVKGWEGGKPLVLANPSESISTRFAGSLINQIGRSFRATHSLDPHSARSHDISSR